MPVPLQRSDKLVARIPPVGEQVAQPWEAVADRADEEAVILELTMEQPAHRQVRIANELRKLGHIDLARRRARRSAFRGIP
jgi:hypothetical protein